MYDLKIENASLITGPEEAKPQAGCLAIKDGRIAAIGPSVSGDAAKTLDAAGQTLCPGFIDLHTHCKPGPNLNYLQAGVTTVLGGNCGFGRVGDTPKVTAGLSGPNLAMLVGHNTVRLEVMGNVNRAPSASELDQMIALVASDMSAGAMGFSAGMTYVPGNYAETEEVIALARAAADAGGIYTAHMRNEHERVIESIVETERIGREAGLPAHISHLKANGAKNWGRATEMLTALEAARARGLDLTWDQYPYPASCGRILLLFSPHLQEGTPDELRERLLTPATRAEAKADLMANCERDYAGDMTRVRIATAPDPTLAGKTLADLVPGNAPALEDVVEAILDLVAKYPTHTDIYCVFHGMSEDDVRELLRHPGTMPASDGWSVRFGEGHAHPRHYGTCPRVLARYAREQKLFSIPEAVRRMTAMPAARLAMNDRGILAEGAWADLVVFDPEKIQDTATFENPHQYPKGIAWVLVNGQVVVDHGSDAGVRPGVFLARNARQPKA